MRLTLKNMIRPLSLAVICMALAACGEDAPPPKPDPKVSFVTVKQEKVTTLMRLSGRAVPTLDSEVRPQVSGIIKSRLFTEGALVKEGEVLYEIDPAVYEAAYQNAQASLMRAEANYVSAKSAADRYTEAVKIRGVSRQDYDNAISAAKQAEAEVASAKAAVESARINLGYTKITSPITGKVGISSVTPGALVTLNQPSPLTTVQQTDPMYIDVTQSSSDYLRLFKKFESGELTRDKDTGLIVSIFLEDGSEYPHKGKLLLRDITVNKSTGSYTIRASIPNTEGMLLPNMYLKAELEEGVNEKGVVIPQQALLRNQRGEPQVYILNAENKVELRPVVTNRAQYGEWVIDSGLQNGDRVIVEGLAKVRPGAPADGIAYVPPADSKNGRKNGTQNGVKKNGNNANEAVKAPEGAAVEPKDATPGPNAAKPDAAKPDATKPDAANPGESKTEAAPAPEGK